MLFELFRSFEVFCEFVADEGFKFFVLFVCFVECLVGEYVITGDKSRTFHRLCDI